MKSLVTWGVVLATLPTAALATEYKAVVPDRSAITFVSRQMNVPVEGRFGKFNATLSFDPAKPEAARAQIEIALASVDAGSAEANDEVKSKNWFDVANFPVARFVSTSLKPLGGDRYQVAGKLTIKGRTGDVSVPLTLKPQGREAVLEGSFTLKRLQYGIGGGVWSDTDTVADDVQIRFRVLATAGK
jgi:polyisoprenoid-binding protein YceI